MGLYCCKVCSSNLSRCKFEADICWCLHEVGSLQQYKCAPLQHYSPAWRIFLIYCNCTLFFVKSPFNHLLIKVPRRNLTPRKPAMLIIFRSTTLQVLIILWSTDPKAKTSNVGLWKTTMPMRMLMRMKRRFLIPTLNPVPLLPIIPPSPTFVSLYHI